jgi:uncharacterized protein (TIGR00369 family)
MSSPRAGYFWEILEGKRPPPPAAVLLGFKLLELDEKAGTIRVSFVADERFLNPAGTVQGGILTAMLDDTMGPAATAFLGGAHIAQTLELKTSFYRPGRIGLIYGTARVKHRGREIIFLEGELTGPDGKLIASATATARIAPVPA